MQKKLPDPSPYSCVVLITSGLSHAILVLLNGFGAVNYCMDHGPCIAVADQVNCGESSVTIFGYDNSYLIATPCRLD